MKKGLLAALIIVLVFSGGLACQKRPSKIQYKLQLEKGKTYILRVVINQKISQTVQGQQKDTNQKIKMTYIYDVIDVDSAGNILIKVTFQAIRFSEAGPRGEIEYDSSNPPTSLSPEFRGLAALVGKSFTLKLAPDGQIKEIKGVDKMIDSMIEQLGVPEDRRDLTEKSLKEQFGNEALKEMITKVTVKYPNKPVEKGSEWASEVTVSKGFPMILENTWKLKERQNGISVIEVSSKIESNTEAEPIEIDSMKIIYKLSGQQKGTVEIQESNGLTKHGQLTQEFSGEVRVEGAPQMAKPQSWPIKVKGQISFEMLELE